MPKRVPVEVDGFTYPSRVDAWRAEAVPGLSYNAFMERLYAGWEPWRALRVKVQQQDHSKGVTQP